MAPMGTKVCVVGTYYGVVITYLILGVKLDAKELCPICLNLVRHNSQSKRP